MPAFSKEDVTFEAILFAELFHEFGIAHSKGCNIQVAKVTNGDPVVLPTSNKVLDVFLIEHGHQTSIN